jgi:hypothetical protein
MRSRFAATTWLLCASFIGGANLATALLVAPNSNCAVQCGNVQNSVSGDQLTCDDSDYKSSIGGPTFQACIACELNSTYEDAATKQTDLQWLLCRFSAVGEAVVGKSY